MSALCVELIDLLSDDGGGVQLSTVNPMNPRASSASSASRASTASRASAFRASTASRASMAAVVETRDASVGLISEDERILFTAMDTERILSVVRKLADDPKEREIASLKRENDKLRQDLSDLIAVMKAKA